MQTPSESSQGLIPELAPGEFVEKPEEIDRLFVRLWPDGTIYFNGTRGRVEEFLHVCTEVGIEVHVDHISLCG